MSSKEPLPEKWASLQIAPDVRERVTACYHEVEKRISLACQKSGRARDSVKLVAVTKQRSLQEVKVLWELGVRDMGENRVQDARNRIPDCPKDIRWHYIGPIQTNKIKYFPGLFQAIHSVYRIDEVQSIQDQYERKNVKKPDYFLQVNVSGEESKQGLNANDVFKFMIELKKFILYLPVGFMTMAPYEANEENLRGIFRSLSNLKLNVEEKINQKIPYLSMGMSNDFEKAIEEGATHLRIGTSLFERDE